MSEAAISRRIRRLLIAWAILSAGMLISAWIFRIDELLAHPQHGLFDHMSKAYERIEGAGKEWAFRSFFILDFFWAAATLCLVGMFSRDVNNTPLLYYKTSRQPASFFFVIFALLAFIADVVEGIGYVWTWESHMLQIFRAKLAMYVICFSFLLYWLLRQFLLPNFKSFLLFVRTAILSISFILLVYLLITLMPQGGTIIVELFYNPWNIALLFFLLTFLAIILSHYPVYGAIWSYGKSKQVELKMAKKSGILGFGIIYYSTRKGRKTSKKTFDNAVVQALRRSLGVLLYIAVFNIMFGVISRFYEVSFNSAGLALALCILTLWIYHREGRKYSRWNKILYDSKSTSTAKQQAVDEIVRYVRKFPWFFVITTAMVFITAFVAAFLKWNIWSILVFLITLGLQMFLYIMFKICRDYLKYVFRSDALEKSNRAMYNPNTLDIFKTYDPYGNERGKGAMLRWFGSLSNNIRYLKIMRWSGGFSLVFLLAANISFSVASFLNPLIIILLYIILFYSVFVILFKHILYYHRKYRQSHGMENAFKYGIPMALVLLIGTAIYVSTLPSDLHRLKTVELREDPLEAKEFAENLTGRQPFRKDNYFFVGSYGGGLKANLWNLLLLHKLDEESNGEFFAKTAVLSGVSGGAVGIGNYTALLDTIEKKDNPRAKKTIAERITEIGRSNVLSNELTHLLGWDYIREFIYYRKDFGNDRAFKSMRHHAKLTGMGFYNEMAVQDYWRRIYKLRDQRYPALIFNTTAVGGQQGISSTVKFVDTPFAGAIDITNSSALHRDSSLTYYGAVSTTNRFPFFSPTAKIKNVGSFLDGGYFDNSGMLSAVGVYDKLIADTAQAYSKLIQPVFISIINSRDFYVTEKLRDFGYEPSGNKETSEVASIINTVTSIEKLPNYTLSKVKTRGFALELLMMPHKLSYSEMAESLDGSLKDPFALMDSITVHNNRINKALIKYEDYHFDKWGVVEPPLARLLSEPAVMYQKAMVECHEDVKDAIQRILVNYIPEDSPIDLKYQMERIKEQQILNKVRKVPRSNSQ